MITCKKSDTLTTSELFTQIADGSSVAFEQFFHSFKSRVFLLIYKMTGSVDASNELSQMFFLNLWEKKLHLKDVQNPGGFIHVCIRRLVLNQIRNEKYQEKKHLGFKRVSECTTCNATQETVDLRQLRKMVEVALLSLPDLKRQVFELRNNGDISYEAISDVLGLTPRTAKAYYYDTLKHLRKYLSEHFSIGISMATLILLSTDCCGYGTLSTL